MENAVRLEAHYYLKNNSHAMDAFIRNRCEAEFLAAVSYIAHRLGVELQFEASIPAEGGFRDIWTVLIHKDNRAVSIPAFTAFLVALLPLIVQIWLAPAKPNEELERQQLEMNRLAIEHSKIENLRLELEVQKLQREINSEPPSTPRPALPAPPAGQNSASSVSAPSSIHHLAQSTGYGLPGSNGAKGLNLQMDVKVNRKRSNFYKQLMPLLNSQWVVWRVKGGRKPGAANP
ncbi:hypothetical protein OKW45_003953 [Paraburkholderia sp. WSM4175]|uniref:hypothetical protein n=1 Tax=Paraburkholderia sp. WSM4175 TaxID=2991072 RepID=UPI003D1C921C